MSGEERARGGGGEGAWVKVRAVEERNAYLGGGLGDGLEHGLGALREGVELEDTGGACGVRQARMGGRGELRGESRREQRRRGGRKAVGGVHSGRCMAGGARAGPVAPFQMTVLEERIFSRKSAIDLGPQSMPSQSSGMPSFSSTSLVGCSSQNFWPHSQSHGKMSSQPLAFACRRREQRRRSRSQRWARRMTQSARRRRCDARGAARVGQTSGDEPTLAISLGTSSAPFLSYSDLPMGMPLEILRKV